MLKEGRWLIIPLIPVLIILSLMINDSIYSARSKRKITAKIIGNTITLENTKFSRREMRNIKKSMRARLDYRLKENLSRGVVQFSIDMRESVLDAIKRAYYIDVMSVLSINYGNVASLSQYDEICKVYMSYINKRLGFYTEEYKDEREYYEFAQRVRISAVPIN